jgi:hypothetical protein
VKLSISEEDSSLCFGMTGESRTNQGRSGDSQQEPWKKIKSTYESPLLPFITKTHTVILNESDAGG